MPVKKPASVADSPFKSEKWDELTAEREFCESDVPTLVLLCQWHAIVEQCMADLDVGGGTVKVSYVNEHDDVRAMPQIATMKQASAEIRALNKQLGIDGEPISKRPGHKASVLTLVKDDRAKKARKRAGA